jgi:formylglycine-generating enzyme required for sulfatase activity
MMRRDIWTNPVDCSTMRLIPEGNFTMGSTSSDIENAIRMDKDGDQFALLNETPQFIAFVPAFYIGIYSVTNAQFARFLSDKRPSPLQLKTWIPWIERILVPSNSRDLYRVLPGFENHPVVNVSWYGADAYCQWAELRLPTETEWEKAARGIDARAFPWGNKWCPEYLCWWGSHGPETTTVSVDAFPQGRSPYGIFQLAGNVEEWCADRYQRDIYLRYALGDFESPKHGLGRVVRSGNCLRRNKLEFRCAMRRPNMAAFANIILTGIRCACDAS